LTTTPWSAAACAGFFDLLDDIEVVGEAENGRRAVVLADELKPT